MSETTNAYVIDTSAWMALLEDEKGADAVQELLERAADGSATVYSSFVSFMKSITSRSKSKDVIKAQECFALMQTLPVLRLESTEQLGLLAGEIKAVHRLLFADVWIVASAQQQDAVLVHKDPEFDPVETIIGVLKLPYKTSGYPK